MSIAIDWIGPKESCGIGYFGKFTAFSSMTMASADRFVVWWVMLSDNDTAWRRWLWITSALLVIAWVILRFYLIPHPGWDFLLLGVLLALASLQILDHRKHDSR